MQSIRPPAVAGMFYPDDASELAHQVNRYTRGAAPSHLRPRAIIAPHAGYVYSGSVAGSAYAALENIADGLERVVMLGPAHREYVPGIAASSADAFATPLGNVELDQERIKPLTEELDYVAYRDSAHDLEHCLEVQLPFLQLALGRFRLLPFAVGNAEPRQVETVLEKLCLEDSTLIVISSDLSHYHDYDTARRLDHWTSEKIVAMDGAGLSGDNACGQRPICGLLRYASRHGLTCELLDLRNSGDTAGPRDRVVGYGAFVFY